MPAIDRLTGFFVGTNTERRIFLRKTRQGDAHLFLVRLRLRLDLPIADHGLGERHAFRA